MRIVPYMVTEDAPIAARLPGEEIEAIVLCFNKGTQVALLYHPRCPAAGECGSIEFAEINNDGNYVAARPVASYINIITGKQLDEIKEELDNITYKDTYLNKEGKVVHTTKTLA